MASAPSPSSGGPAIDASSVSQQLAVLRTRQLVTGRKEGTSVYYSADPQVYALLDIARAIFESQLVALQAMAEAPSDEGVSGAHEAEAGRAS